MEVNFNHILLHASPYSSCSILNGYWGGKQPLRFNAVLTGPSMSLFHLSIVTICLTKSFILTFLEEVRSQSKIHVNFNHTRMYAECNKCCCTVWRLVNSRIWHSSVFTAFSKCLNPHFLKRYVKNSTLMWRYVICERYVKNTLRFQLLEIISLVKVKP